MSDPTTILDRAITPAEAVDKACPICGKAMRVWRSNIARGYGRFCSIQCSAAGKRVHGLSSARSKKIGQNSYYMAKKRCHNPRDKNYPSYGAVGITMCDRWRFGENGKTGLECFFDDMGPKPNGNYTLERKDNRRGYAPDNCIWATRKTQARNKRNNRRVVRSDGASYATIGTAAEENGLSYENIRSACRGLSKTAGGYGWKYVSG